MRVVEEESLQVAGLGRDRAQPRQSRRRVRLVAVRRPDRDRARGGGGRLRRGGQHHPAGQGGAEFRGHRQPVLRVERVFEGPAEDQGFSCRGAKSEPGWLGGRSPATRVPRCMTMRVSHSTPLTPTMQPRSHAVSHLTLPALPISPDRPPALANDGAGRRRPPCTPRCRRAGWARGCKSGANPSGACVSLGRGLVARPGRAPAVGGLCQGPDAPRSGSGRASFLAAGGGVELCLAQPDRLRRDLDALVGAQELEGLVE